MALFDFVTLINELMAIIKITLIMKLTFINFFLLFFLFNFSFGQNKFEIKNGSKEYVAELIVENCSEENCEGNGTVKLINRITTKVIQTFTSENLYFYFDKNTKTTVNIIQLFNEQSTLNFVYFNFK